VAATALAALQQHGFAARDIRLLVAADDVVRCGVGVAEADRQVFRAAVRYAVVGMVVGALLYPFPRAVLRAPSGASQMVTSSHARGAASVG